MEFWSFTLVNFLIGIVFGLSNFIFINSYNFNMGVVIVSAIFTLGMFLPSLAVGIRRFHDTGNSGWVSVILSIIGLIQNLSSSIGQLVFPSYYNGMNGLDSLGVTVVFGILILGLAIYALVIYFTNGTYGPNKYGPDPKQPDLGNEIDEIGNE
jgi:uncharacterized membrane protein YhaH (DUF805 family)